MVVAVVGEDVTVAWHMGEDDVKTSSTSAIVNVVRMGEEVPMVLISAELRLMASNSTTKFVRHRLCAYLSISFDLKVTSFGKKTKSSFFSALFQPPPSSKPCYREG